MRLMLLKRCVVGIILVFFVSVFIFVVTQILPGDAAQIRLGQFATPEALRAIRIELGLDKPLLNQYLSWAIKILTGDLGISSAGSATVSSLIAGRIGNTVFMTVAVTCIAVPLSIFLGLTSAIHAGGKLDRVITSTSLGFIALPDFMIGIVLILIFAVQFDLVPAVSYLGADADFWDKLYALCLPIVTLVVVVSAQMIRMIRAGILNVMSLPYIEMAILKGVPKRRIILRHALPNAIGPVVNVIALNLAYLVSGVVVVETIFSYPGLAKLMVDGVQSRDMALVQACSMIFCTTYIVLILIADVASFISNPRLRNPK